MLDVLLERLKQGKRTIAYPAQAPTLPDRYRGKPVIDAAKCTPGCRACAEACPTAAVEVTPDCVRLDLGRCLFCGDCAQVCPQQALTFSRDYRLAVSRREELVMDGETLKLAEAMEAKIRRIFGRSLKLRQVSAGGCNACEADVNVLGTIVYDLGRFGIQFVASPRHADGLLLTGPVPENMRLGLLKTYAAIPEPKVVIAVGSCAISGGPFAGQPEVCPDQGALLPVDLFVPGCPPHPLTILDGMLRLLGRLEHDPLR